MKIIFFLITACLGNIFFSIISSDTQPSKIVSLELLAARAVAANLSESFKGKSISKISAPAQRKTFTEVARYIPKNENDLWVNRCRIAKNTVPPLAETPPELHVIGKNQAAFCGNGGLIYRINTETGNTRQSSHPVVNDCLEPLHDGGFAALVKIRRQKQVMIIDASEETHFINTDFFRHHAKTSNLYDLGEHGLLLREGTEHRGEKPIWAILNYKVRPPTLNEVPFLTESSHSHGAHRIHMYQGWIMQIDFDELKLYHIPTGRTILKKRPDSLLGSFYLSNLPSLQRGRMFEIRKDTVVTLHTLALKDKGLVDAQRYPRSKILDRHNWGIDEIQGGELYHRDKSFGLRMFKLPTSDLKGFDIAVVNGADNSLVGMIKNGEKLRRQDAFGIVNRSTLEPEVQVAAWSSKPSLSSIKMGTLGYDDQIATMSDDIITQVLTTYVLLAQKKANPESWLSDIDDILKQFWNTPENKMQICESMYEDIQTKCEKQYRLQS